MLDEESGDCALGAASRWWLQASLLALAESLSALGSRLVLRRGPTEDVFAALIRETGAAAIAWNRLYEPRIMARDRRIKARCADAGIDVRSFSASLLYEPWDVITGSGLSYRVFTPFWRHCLKRGFEAPSSPPTRLPTPPAWPCGETLDDWDLHCRTPERAAGLRRTWRPGESGARARLDAFVDDALDGYREGRDRPGEPGTSMLSPNLRFGEIGPRQVAAAIGATELGPGSDSFLRELRWREFAHQLLFHNPDMESTNMRLAFDRMEWRDDPASLGRWQRGLTGYPLVDAGMRELWATGWMHNRVRMVAASFLVKHLLVDCTYSSTGVPARRGSSTHWSMPTGRTTARAGSGSRDRASTRRPGSGSSIRSRSRSASTAKDAICAAGFPSFVSFRTRSFMRRGQRRSRYWTTPASASGRHGPCQSLIMRAPENGRSPR